MEVRIDSMTNQKIAKGDDRPIEDKGQDKFGFQGYASVLTNRILQAHPPLTIGIFGSWGSGKSSLMNLIKENIADDPNNKIHTLELNVWELSNQEEVWHAFIQTLFGMVSKKLWWGKKIDWRKFVKLLFKNILKIFIVIVPVILGGLLQVNPEEMDWDFVIKVLSFGDTTLALDGSAMVGYLAALYFVLKPAFKEARNAVNFDVKSVLKYDSYEAQITELTNLKNRFEKMVKAWVKNEGRLLVFIDDLDRCTPDKIPDVIEAIKLFSTSPQCIYVLGLDHDIVRKGIAKKYAFEEGEKKKGDREESAEYLEKIVQLPFHLPPIEKGYIQDFIEEGYQDETALIECPTAPEIFAEGLDPNPRKVKRALNIYLMLWDLADDRWKNWEMDERVDPELLAKMVVVQSGYRPLYSFLVRNPVYLLHLQDGEPYKKPDKNENVIKSPPDPSRGVLENWDKFIDDSTYDDAELFSSLSSILNIGESRFTEENMDRYIYLTAAAEGASGDAIKPSREERVALLGSDPEKIADMVKEIKERGENNEERDRITKNYTKLLEVSVLGGERFDFKERLSADTALDHFEDRVRKDFEPKTVFVEGGEFLMGSVKPSERDQTQQKGQLAQQKSRVFELVVGEDVLDFDAEDNELPQHTSVLPDYYIGRYPVTNLEYQHFVRESEHKPPDYWKKNEFPEELIYHPVVEVTWHDAVGYCKWLSEASGINYRLPSEAEWEKAARGGDGRIYPWGNQWDPAFANTVEGGKRETTVIGSYPGGASPYGALDMSGNVREWTRSLWGKEFNKPDFIYPYGPVDGREEMDAEGLRVLRGGSFNHGQRNARCASRYRGFPDERAYVNGFRVLFSPFPTEQSEVGFSVL